MNEILSSLFVLSIHMSHSSVEQLNNMNSGYNEQRQTVAKWLNDTGIAQPEMVCSLVVRAQVHKMG